MPKSTFGKKKGSPRTLIDWMPLHRMLLPDVLSFGSVHGIARVFLIIEIVLSVCVVCGTVLLLMIQLF